MQVIANRAPLCEFEEDSCWVLVWGVGEARLNGLQKRHPRRELVVAGHPLEPRKSGAFHSEGGDGKALWFQRRVIGKKLGGFEHPPRGVGAIKFWNIEFHFWWVMGCVWCGVGRGRRW